MRQISVDLYDLLNVLYLLREEQGTTGWLIRERIADMLKAPLTEHEIQWFLDEQSRKHNRATTSESLIKYAGNDAAIDDIWGEFAYREHPIAQLMALWDHNGNRRPPGRTMARWTLTPKKHWRS